ncbi:hypothetical protein F751_6475 [Auxenochlorella protothecoides]|uniref:Uncharacterized protein n=2 Tax=Auxenochlorella protothecoides TaxID=3075 RepID=A0A087STA2_AUXPR|nr:hypothetical protein F751_6475 [Auxenochlorella protothecoides]KFM28956.1 hypothetical protein F751_6475 [Auxenochlorella protothecoides]
MGLMGRRLTSYRECTRDAEWQLYLLTLVTNMGDLEAIAECTSGDAACLRAPAELECMELAELGRSLPDLKPSRQWLGLDFTCTTLLVGETGPGVFPMWKRYLFATGGMLRHAGTIAA